MDLSDDPVPLHSENSEASTLTATAAAAPLNSDSPELMGSTQAGGLASAHNGNHTYSPSPSTTTYRMKRKKFMSLTSAAVALKSKLLKLSLTKLGQITDPEIKLRRCVLIYNAAKALKKEIVALEEKRSAAFGINSPGNQSPAQHHGNGKKAPGAACASADFTGGASAGSRNDPCYYGLCSNNLTLQPANHHYSPISNAYGGGIPSACPGPSGAAAQLVTTAPVWLNGAPKYSGACCCTSGNERVGKLNLPPVALAKEQSRYSTSPYPFYHKKTYDMGSADHKPLTNTNYSLSPVGHHPCSADGSLVAREPFVDTGQSTAISVGCLTEELAHPERPYFDPMVGLAAANDRKSDHGLDANFQGVSDGLTRSNAPGHEGSNPAKPPSTPLSSITIDQKFDLVQAPKPDFPNGIGFGDHFNHHHLLSSPKMLPYNVGGPSGSPFRLDSTDLLVANSPIETLKLFDY